MYRVYCTKDKKQCPDKELLDMIFKVFYQPLRSEAPVRERTETMYVEGESIRDVRSTIDHLKEINIEFIREVSGEFLTYEQQHPDFKVATFE